MTLYAGFDIGGTNARLGLYDEDWAELARDKRGVRGASQPSQLAGLIHEMLVDGLEQADLKPGSLNSVGVGLAGQLDRDHQTVLNAPNLGWRDIRFLDLVAEKLGEEMGDVTLGMFNDLSALLWGEYNAGAVEDVRDVLAVYVGTGVGGAMLVDGRLVDGAGGKAGELGHSKVAPGGRLCGCGERGCVEAYAGGVHLETQVAYIAEDKGLDELVDGDDVDLAAADRLADDVDALGELWERATDYLGLVLANACTLLNPAVLLLGGGILQNLEGFRRRTLTKITPLVLEAAREDLEIRWPELGDEAGILGAAMLAADAGAG